MGEHFSVFYTTEDRAQGKPAEILDVAARFDYVEDEGWRVRKDGSRFWARVTLTALHGENGQPHSYLKVTRDMTERRRQEKQLEESERKVRQLAEQSLTGHTLIQEGEFQYVNPQAARMFEYSTGWPHNLPASACS